MARLLIAAIALFLGGIPPLLKIIPSGSSSLFGFAGTLLTLLYLISGAAALYLLYMWNKEGMKVFGGKDKKDMIAFFVLIVSGINLGLVPIIKSNIGMSIFGGDSLSSLPLFFLIGGIIYLVTLIYLLKQWKSHGKKLF